MSHIKSTFLRLWIKVFFVAGLTFASTAQAAPIQIVIDTSSLNGVAANLAFDFIDGGTPTNSVTVSGFTSDGSLGSSSSSGSVSGVIPNAVTLSDTSFFSEYLQNITLGNSLTFSFDATAGVAELASFPDTFSFFLLNADGTASLVTSTDPTGSDSLVIFSIGNTDPLTVYAAGGITIDVDLVRGIPEPGTLILSIVALAVTLGALYMTRRRTRSQFANHS